MAVPKGERFALFVLRAPWITLRWSGGPAISRRHERVPGLAGTL
jgi:hypothetical protein